jgi:cytochrome c oxidase cbb3-type subunit 3
MRGINKISSVLLVIITLASLSTGAWALNFEESVANGKTVYEENCANCHGAEGEGGAGTALNSKAKLDSLGLENVKHSIEAGVEGTDMPAWEGELSEEEIDDLVHFIFGEWAGLVIVGIEMWPWEIAYVCVGLIWALMGMYYVIRV